ncbi:hypothetical protein DSL92_01375 [Billgrantia gudaonensis]|uniref:Uncharacterized protein n=1 Tax=Billgrantia gudaonensis TaxID=376427 RepID=A0A432JKI7_9GAMM|nr:hypothetical protein DSL92_01375 [Halomonas gudaonensis]
MPPTDIAALGLLTLSWSHPGSVNVESLQHLLRDLPREMLRFKGIVVLDDGRVGTPAGSWACDQSRACASGDG